MEFHKDMEALQCLPPALEPKATDHVPDMVKTIEQIIASGHGYAVDGDVFFDTVSLQGYGRLSRRQQARILCTPDILTAQESVCGSRGQKQQVLFCHQPN